MCVIAVKKRGVQFPGRDLLENCFANNPDGAGFMYALGGKVHIRKGFPTFKKFWDALGRARRLTGDKAAYVMHFRIATQGFELSMTHPFPLTTDIREMKRLKSECSVGVAHNGVIPLTSDGSKDYSDTMRFIRLYLTALIRNRRWKDDPNTVDAIETIINGSRLSIMESDGSTTEMGQGWTEHEGILYSNSSYSYSLPSHPYGFGGFHMFGRGARMDWKQFKCGSEFLFEEDFCPLTEEDDDSYCEKCANRMHCMMSQYYNEEAMYD